MFFYFALLLRSRYAQENVNKILIGNKSDLGDKRKVNFEEGSELGTPPLFQTPPLKLTRLSQAKQYKIPFLEVSAKSALNIEKAFTSISKQVMERMANSNFKESKGTGGVKIGAAKSAGSNPSNGYKQGTKEGDCC